MEDDPDDLDNIFEEYESTSRQEVSGNVNNIENPASNEAKSPERVPVPRRIVKNPRLKFNPDRLCGERGIPILVKHFKDVKFKGKGREKEDLDKLLSSLTHWCHRLFPSMKFEDCLRQIEKLGKKRPVQTCLRKIRLDMPILNTDFVHDDEVEREEVQDEPNIEPVAEDAFDRLFNENAETTVSNFTSTPMNKQPTGNTLGTSFGSNLTEEQRKRMEYNRLLATERRKAKLASVQSTDSEFINNDSGLGLPSSGSQVVDLDSYQFEGTSSSITNSPVQSQDSQFENVDNYEVNNQTAIAKDSEELGIDELMDLVEDEDPSIGNEKDRTYSVDDVLISDDQINSNDG